MYLLDSPWARASLRIRDSQVISRLQCKLTTLLQLQGRRRRARAGRVLLGVKRLNLSLRIKAAG
jgi:hypothetical protein